MTTARILLVEDNPIDVALITEVLESAGLTLLTAKTAEEAQSLLAATLPDLILMDIALPAMQGLTLTGQIKSALHTRHIPIIALTAFAMKGDEQRALEAGCDGYLTKPIDAHTLPDRIAKFLTSTDGDSPRIG